MTTDPVLIIGIHPATFRGGEPARIIGVSWANSWCTNTWRMCYEIEFADGTKDYVVRDEAHDETKYRFVMMSKTRLAYKCI